MRKVNADIGRFQNLLSEEHDSCGIVAIIEKNGKPTHANLLDTIDALIKMEHRSGFINGEGDGCGILTDIPRALWAQKLTQAGYPSEWGYEETFAVAHLFVPKRGDITLSSLQDRIRRILKDNGLRILVEAIDAVNSQVLGKNGRADEPHFWQIALRAESAERLPARLFDLVIQLERDFPLQVASFSNRTVVYKVMGAANLLPKYFHDLGKAEFQTVATIGHNRYSTNTLSNFFRVQPFSLLGHNGEINTVRKLGDEAQMIGVPLAEGGSDSQDLNRVMETLIHRYDFSLLEAIEMVFPRLSTRSISCRLSCRISIPTTVKHGDRSPKVRRESFPVTATNAPSVSTRSDSVRCGCWKANDVCISLPSRASFRLIGW